MREIELFRYYSIDRICVTSDESAAADILRVHRRFLTEAVYDLRDRLRGTYKSNLLIRFGKTEVVATNVVKSLLANGDKVKVFLQQEVSFRIPNHLTLLSARRVLTQYHCQWTHEEAKSQEKLAIALQKLGVYLTYFDTIPLGTLASFVVSRTR